MSAKTIISPTPIIPMPALAIKTDFSLGIVFDGMGVAIKHSVPKGDVSAPAQGSRAANSQFRGLKPISDDDQK